MKYILTEEEHGKLPDAVKEEYTKNGDVFQLTLEGHEEAFVPKNKKDLAEQHRKAAETKVAELEASQAKLLKDLEASKGNAKAIEDVRAQFQTEMEKMKLEYAEKEKATKAESFKAMIDAEATKFASEHFTVPSAISRLYKDRLTIEEVDGQPVIRALEPNGKPSVKSVSDLQKEFLDNKEFSPIVKATKGSGSSAARNSDGKGSSAAKSVSRSEFDAMSQDDRFAFVTKEGGTVQDDQG